MEKLNELGRFRATVIATDFGQAASGTPYLYIALVAETAAGQRATSKYLYLSEKSFERTVRQLRVAFGFDGNFENIEQILGKEIEIETHMEADQKGGEAKLRVKDFDAGGTPLDDKPNLLRQWSEKARRIPLTPPPAAAPTTRPAAAARPATAARPAPATRQAPPPAPPAGDEDFS